MRFHSLRTKFLLLALVPSLFPVVSAIFVQRAIAFTGRAHEDVLQGQEALYRVTGLTQSVLDAEAGVRGFVTTGTETFLQPYQTGLSGFDRGLEVTRSLLTPPVQHRVEHVAELFHAWRNEVAEPLIIARRGVPGEMVLASRRAVAMLPQIHLTPRGTTSAAADPARAVALADLLQDIDRIEERAPPEQRETLAELVRLGKEAQRTGSDASIIALEQAILGWDAAMRKSEGQVQRLLAAGKNGELTEALRHEMSDLVDGLQQSVRDRELASRVASEWAAAMGWAGPLLGLVLSGAMSLFLALRFARTARSISDAVEALGRGKLDERARVRSRDELGRVAVTFNILASQLQVRTRETSTLGQLSELLQACDSEEELWSVVERFGPMLFPDRSGALHAIDASRDLVVRVAAWKGPPLAEGEETFPLDACWALRTGRIFWQDPSSRGVHCGHLKATSGTWMCLPLSGQGETVGCLCLGAEEADSPQVHADVARLVTTFGEQVALALVNLRLREKLRHQAIRDPLTGLFNRRYLEETLLRELERARRRGRPLSVLVLDVNHFKRVNDTLGHQNGDQVLAVLAQHLRSHVRGEDIPCRFGGEEFVVVMPEADLNAALARGEQLRREIKTLRPGTNVEALTPVTISVGVACYPQHGEDPGSLLEAADAALYAAKRAGRDQVHAAARTALSA